MLGKGESVASGGGVSGDHSDSNRDSNFGSQSRNRPRVPTRDEAMKTNEVDISIKGKGKDEKEMLHSSEIGKRKTTAPRPSRMVTHYSITWALCSLTLEIGRDPVRSARYGRS